MPPDHWLTVAEAAAIARNARSQEPLMRILVLGLLILAAVINAEAAAQLLRRALARAGVSEKACAYGMGISPVQLSKQLAGEQHLSLNRLLAVPEVADEVAILLLSIGQPVHETITVRRRPLQLSLSFTHGVKRAEAA